MIIEYALLAMKSITEVINCVADLIEDYKIISTLAVAGFLFLIFFVIGRKW